MARRISHNNVGEVFNLLFTGEANAKPEKWELTSLFLLKGCPDSGRAYFQRVSNIPGEYGQNIEVYRHTGRWCYGSSAQIVRSVDF